MYFQAFGQCFRIILDTALQKLEICSRATSKFPITENKIEKLLLVRFLLLLLFRQMVEKLHLFLDQIAISQLILNPRLYGVF